MSPPRSIKIFDIAYLAMLAINLAGPILLWSALTETVIAEARLRPDQGGMVDGLLVGGLLLIAALGLLLWWFVARRRSTIARWIAVLVLGYGLVSSALGLAQAEGAIDLVRGLTLLGMVFTAVALATLFMTDTRRWFAMADVVDADA